MADVFLSYASKDRDRVQPLAQALEQSGLVVWWDRYIQAGQRYDEVIEEKLRDARCVVAVWSVESVKSAWVKEEAAYARERGHGLLLPIRIDDVDPPIAFRMLQTTDLSGWDGDPHSPVIAKLLHNIHLAIGTSSDTGSMLGSSVDQPPPVSGKRRRSPKKWLKFWK